MIAFKAALHNELDKIIKKKKVMAAAILSIIAVIIGQLAVTVLKNNMGLRVVGSSEFAIMVLSFLTYTLLPLFSTFVAIDMFSGEFSSNTMKITLTRPVSRFKIFCAKAASVGIFILANLLFVMALSLVAGLFFNVSSGGVIGFVRVVVSYIFTFFPLFTFSLFVILLTNIFRGGLPVFLLSILVFIVMMFLGMFFSNYSSFFITSMFDWYRLFISDHINFFKIIRYFMIIIGSGIMFFTAGYYLFEKKDL